MAYCPPALPSYLSDMALNMSEYQGPKHGSFTSHLAERAYPDPTMVAVILPITTAHVTFKE